MAVPAILHDLIGAGVEFATDGERIRWRNAAGRITPEVIHQLRAHKAEVIDFLTGKAIQPAAPAAPHGNVIAWPYSPEAIRQGVADAFEDFEAMNNPQDERAWQ